MKKHYDFANSESNPYAGKLTRPITIPVGTDVIEYFKQMAGLPLTIRVLSKHFNILWDKLPMYIEEYRDLVRIHSLAGHSAMEVTEDLTAEARKNLGISLSAKFSSCFCSKGGWGPTPWSWPISITASNSASM